MPILTIAVPVKVVVHDAEAAKAFTEETLKAAFANVFAKVFPRQIGWGTTKIVALDGKPRAAVGIILADSFGVEVAADPAPEAAANGAAPRIVT